MAAHDYEAIADRADVLLPDLPLHAPLGANSEDMHAPVKGLQPALNAKLHEEYPGLAPGGVRIAGATPVPRRRIPLSILLEMVDQGFKVGMWTVDYDGSGHLPRRDAGYLRAQRGDDVARQANAGASSCYQAGRQALPRVERPNYNCMTQRRIRRGCNRQHGCPAASAA